MFSLGNVRRKSSRSEFQLTSSIGKELDRDRVNQKTTVKSQPAFVYFHSECTDFRHVHSLWKTRQAKLKACSNAKSCVNLWEMRNYSVLESLFIHFQLKTLLDLTLSLCQEARSFKPLLLYTQKYFWLNLNLNVDIPQCWKWDFFTWNYNQLNSNILYQGELSVKCQSSSKNWLAIAIS